MSFLNNKILTIEPTVGYMLKVIKSGQTIIKYNDEFKAIRHGNYFNFLNLVKGPIPFMVSYTNGVIRTEEYPQKEDCDFAGLAIRPSLSFFLCPSKKPSSISINSSSVMSILNCRV